jgi:type II secretory pathway pseudopilin PulG
MNEKRGQAGFTIIESLVVAAIVIFFTTFTVIRLNTQTAERLVQREAELFYSTISYTRTLTLSGKVFRDEDGDIALDVPNGYGLYVIDNTSYTTFGDLLLTPTTRAYDAGEEIPFGLTVLDTNVGVNLYDLNDIALTPPLAIIFETPGADMFITAAPPPTGGGVKAEFYYLNNPAVKRTVILNAITNQLYAQ